MSNPAEGREHDMVPTLFVARSRPSPVLSETLRGDHVVIEFHAHLLSASQER